MNRMKRRFFALILALSLCLIAATAAGAADYYFAGEERADYQIILNQDGSAQFTETRVVGFHGDHEFTRYGRYYLFDGERDITDWSVTLDGQELTQLSAPDNDARPENTFAVEDTDEGQTLFIYHRTTGNERELVISYRVENAVVLYDDAAEFFWDLSSKNELSNIPLLTAKITIPEGVGSEFRIWAHGPLNGSFIKSSDSSADLRVENVPTDDPVDMRVTAPRQLFSGGWEKGGAAMADILANEQELADKANAEREEQARLAAEDEQERIAREAEEALWREQHPIKAKIKDAMWSLEMFQMDVSDALMPLLVVIAFIGTPGAYIASRVLGKKAAAAALSRHKPDQEPPYYRQLPDKRPAATVDRLLSFYSKNKDGDVGRQLSATLMAMNLKGLIKLQSADSDTFISVQKSATAPESYEIPLIELLNCARGSAPSLSLKELQRYIKKNPENARELRSSFDYAVFDVFSGQYKLEYLTIYDKGWLKKQSLRVLAAALIAAVLGLVLMGPVLAFVPFICVAAVGMAWVMARYSCGRGSILDQASENAMALWSAFGRFLDDFTTFDEKELPEFALWREYLVYAVAIGRGKKLARELAMRYPDPTSDSDHEFYRDWLYNQRLLSALDEVAKAANSIPEPKSSNSSSGSGGGGGFSSSSGGSGSGSGGSFAN